jgi:hypothetical protein
MKVRVGRGSVSFVKKEDGARFHSTNNPRRDRIRAIADGVETSDRPANQLHLAAGERRVNKEILQTGRGAEISGGDVASIDLGGDPSGRKTPERSARVGSSMIGYFVTRGANRLHLSRKFRDPFSDNKEGRLGSKLLENFENTRGVNWIRPIVDRQPDFAPRGLEMGHNRTPRLAVWDQGREEDQEVGGEKHGKREERLKRDQGDKKERREDGEAKNQSPDRLRTHAGVGR